MNPSFSQQAPLPAYPTPIPLKSKQIHFSFIFHTFHLSFISFMSVNSNTAIWIDVIYTSIICQLSKHSVFRIPHEEKLRLPTLLKFCLTSIHDWISTNFVVQKVVLFFFKKPFSAFPLNLESCKPPKRCRNGWTKPSKKNYVSIFTRAWFRGPQSWKIWHSAYQNVRR